MSAAKPPTQEADEVRVSTEPKGDVTLWCVDLYLSQKPVRRIGSSMSKWQAVATALNIAETLSVDEVNVH